MSGPEITLRAAGDADGPFLARLLADLRGAHDAPESDAKAAQRLTLLLGAGYKPFVGEEAGVPIGYALTQENGDHVFIRQFVVAPEARRRGVGRAMARALADWFGWPEMRLDVMAGREDARAFWAALGFEPAATNMRRPALEEF